MPEPVKELSKLPGIIPEPEKTVAPPSEEPTKPVEVPTEVPEKIPVDEDSLDRTEPDIFKGITVESFKRDAVEKPTEVAPPAAKPVVDKPKDRDLSFADEADRPLFKQMSNEAYEKLSSVYKQNKELLAKPQVPAENQSLFAHEQGYLLTPEFEVMNRKSQLASQIVDHWERQLINIRNGKQWTGLAFDEKTGELFETDPQGASEEAEVKALRALRITTAQQSEISNKLSNFVSGHKAKHSEVVDFVNKTVEEYFPGYEKPDHPSAQLQKAIVDNMHPALKSDPLLRLLKVTGASNAMLRHQLKLVQAELDAAKGLKKDLTEAPPPASVIKSGGPNNKSRVVSYDDFKAERNR